MTGPERRRRRRLTAKQTLAAALSVVLTVTLLQVLQYSAAPEAPPGVQREPVVAGRVAAPVTPPPASTGTPYRAGKAVWPAASTVEVDVKAGGVRPAGLPVRLEPAAGAGPSRVRLQVYDRAAAADAGVAGVLLRVGRVDGTSEPAAVRMTVDYGGFAQAYGADWSNRLRLVALSAPQVSAPVDNDVRARTVSADVTVAAQARGGSLMALAAAPEGKTGDYSATSLQPSSTWSAGSNTGDFNWNYPIRTPKALGGPEPGIALSYNSASVDGRMAASNNQPSWIGEGFDWDPGYIERRYTTCAEDQGDGHNNTDKTGDQCWVTDNATLSMSGHAGELIKEPGPSERWHLRNEDGTKIERRYNIGNGARDGEHWVVTTTDGAQFWFGRSAQSTLTVPVAGNHATDPCRATAFKDSFCTQAYRWNLEYVVDVSGNTMSYTYAKETNRYARNNKTTEEPVAYDRSSHLTRIDYGTRADTAGVPFSVQFDTADRCLSNCADKENWPDTPKDQECTGKPCNTTSPTFWSTKRLTTITTKVADAPVESWTLHQSFPNPGDSTRAGLWLDRIEHKGLGVAGETATTPDVSFVGIQKHNRVDSDDHSPPMNWWRIEKIVTESGGVVKLTYSDRDCVAGSRMPDPHALQNNTLRCYPIKWTPLGHTEAVTDYFHKYVVKEVTEEDRTGGSTRVITRYDYLGDPAWHYTDEDGITKDKDKTWAGWRGYGAVKATKGDPGEQTSIETRFFRGMHGDKLPSGTRSVQLPAIAVGNVPAVNDEDQYSGMTRETITYDGPGGAEISAEAAEPWRSPPTVTRQTNGITVEARFADIAVKHRRTALDGNRPPLTASQVTTFDDTYGLPVSVEDRGAPGAGDEQCALTDYVHNTGNWLIGLVSRERSLAVDCARAVAAGPSLTGLTAADVLGDDRTFHDGLPFGAVPALGRVTRAEALKSVTGGAPAYIAQTVTAYDAHGRPVAVTDAKGTTRTEYTPAKGGPVTQTVARNILGWPTTTTFATAWNLPLSVVDPNGRRTDMDYDGFGRLTKVWLPGRDKAGQSPSQTYTYRMRNDAATSVSTSKLGPNGGYTTSWSLYDGLLRPRQSQKFDAAGSGKGVYTDAFYDSAGREVRTNDEYLGASAPTGDLYVHTASTVPGQTTTVYDGAGRTTAEIFKVNVPSGGSPGGTEKWRTRTVYAGDRTHRLPPSELGPTSMIAPPSNTATTEILDALGRVVERRQYHAGATVGSAAPGDYDATKYDYNRKDELIRVTDPVGNQWTYTFDLRGRRVSVADPDMGVTTTTYTDQDEIETVTNGAGARLAYTYDELGRKKTLRDGSTTGPVRATWDYDTTFNGTSVKGQIVRSTRLINGQAYVKENRTFTVDYQASGVRYTIPATEAGLGGTYDYVHTFYPDGSPRTTRLPAVGDLQQETVEHEYDSQGRAIKQHSAYGANPRTTLVESTEFTSFGETGRVVLRTNGGNSVDIVRQYEEGTRRLTQIKTVRQTAPTAVADIRYGYDLAGNVTRVSDEVSGDTQCFTVDWLRRLSEAWTPANGDCSPANRTEAALGGPAKYWQSYTYDAVGSRTELVERATPAGVRTTRYTVPAGKHALTGTTTEDNAGVRAAAYTYDTAGNLRTRPGQTLTWDSEGLLSTVEDNAGPTRHVYDADGGRLIRDDPAGRTLYLPGQELRQAKNTGTKTATRHYSHGGDSVATRNGAGLTWLSGDHHGTSGVFVDAAGQSITRRRETPFGQPRGAAAVLPAGFEKGFVGGTVDPTGLTHLGAREYDPLTGRFVSVDPEIDNTDPQQMHGYAYGNNNPLSYSDPDGRFSFSGALKKAGNAVVGAAKSAGNAVKNVAVSTVKSIKEDPLKFATGLVVGVAVAVAVGAVCATGVGCVILAGAVAGAAAAGAEYGVDVAQGEKKFSLTELGKEMAIGGAIGGVTAGLGPLGGKVFSKVKGALGKSDGLADDVIDPLIDSPGVRNGGGAPSPGSVADDVAETAAGKTDDVAEAAADTVPGKKPGFIARTWPKQDKIRERYGDLSEAWAQSSDLIANHADLLHAQWLDSPLAFALGAGAAGTAWALRGRFKGKAADGAKGAGRKWKFWKKRGPSSSPGDDDDLDPPPRPRRPDPNP